MIAATYTGWHPAGLLAYLLGPGRYEEHVRPRIVAGSLSPAVLNPVEVAVRPELLGLGAAPEEPDRNQETGMKGSLWTDNPALQRLFSYVETGVADAGLPLRNPKPGSRFFGRPGYVWHTAVRLHPDDPILDDPTWAVVGRRLIRALGIEQAGCRWVAVRHGDDHIHVAAILVHRVDGQYKRFHPKWWKRRMREECDHIEKEMGLRPTSAADRTAAPSPTKGELRKADRSGRVVPRLWLRRSVAEIAATVSTPTEFEVELRRRGIRVRYRHGADGEVIGYAVAAPQIGDDRASFFSGSKLAPDMTWPQLLRRWASAPTVEPVERTVEDRVSQADTRAELADASRVVAETTAAVNALPMGDGAEGVPQVAYATGEVLYAMARTAEAARGGGFSDSAATFAPVTRHGPPPTQPRPGEDRNAMAEVSWNLRIVARRLLSIGAFPVPTARNRTTMAQAQFALALAALIAEIAAWHHDRRNRAHAAMATDAAAQLRHHYTSTPTRRAASTPTTEPREPTVSQASAEHRPRLDAPAAERTTFPDTGRQR